VGTGLLAYAAIFLIIMLVLPQGILPTITERLRAKAKLREVASMTKADTDAAR
jgi:hypothetical protein